MGCSEIFLVLLHRQILNCDCEVCSKMLSFIYHLYDFWILLSFRNQLLIYLRHDTSRISISRLCPTTTQITARYEIKNKQCINNYIHYHFSVFVFP